MQFLRLTILCALMLACGAASVFAQASSSASCALKQAPALQGFRLGMTVAEVKEKLEDSSMFDSKISSGNAMGTRAVNISAAELKAEYYVDGLESVYLSFVDDHLSHIKATYNGAERWDGLASFFARESEGLGLPKPNGPDALQGSGGNEKYTVECGEFTATLAYSFGVAPSISVSNTKAKKMVDSRRAKDTTGTRTVNVDIFGNPGRPVPPPPTPQSDDPNKRPFSENL